MEIALVSLNQSWENKKENQLKVENALSTIFKNATAVDLVIFPEMTLTSFSMESRKIKEVLETSKTVAFFKNNALKYKTFIAFGVVLSRGDKATNSLIVVNPLGEIEAIYAKIHPFSFAKENQFYEEGNKLTKCSIKSVCVGLTICYDLRFPELYQGYSKDCQLIINIANWPERRVSHWNTLLQARAIENQSFVVGVNRVGIDGNGLSYQKSSQIISPQGTILKGIPLSDEIDIYTIDISEAEQYRENFPVKNDRKVNLYKQIL